MSRSFRLPIEPLPGMHSYTRDREMPAFFLLSFPPPSSYQAGRQAWHAWEHTEGWLFRLLSFLFLEALIRLSSHARRARARCNVVSASRLIGHAIVFTPLSCYFWHGEERRERQEIERRERREEKRLLRGRQHRRGQEGDEKDSRRAMPQPACFFCCCPLPCLSRPAPCPLPMPLPCFHVSTARPLSACSAASSKRPASTTYHRLHAFPDII